MHVSTYSFRVHTITQSQRCMRVKWSNACICIHRLIDLICFRSGPKFWGKETCSCNRDAFPKGSIQRHDGCVESLLMIHYSWYITHDTNAHTKKTRSVRGKLIFEHGIFDLGCYIVHSDILVLVSCYVLHIMVCVAGCHTEKITCTVKGCNDSKV